MLLGEDGRGGRRQRALDAAIGLSVGVENQSFGGARTFAEVEENPIRTIRRATVGGTALDMTGRWLDGAEDSLSTYRGRVALIDFWMTGVGLASRCCKRHGTANLYAAVDVATGQALGRVTRRHRATELRQLLAQSAEARRLAREWRYRIALSGSRSATSAPGCLRRALPACMRMYCTPSSR